MIDTSDLRPGQVYRMNDGSVVVLDRPVPGDATKWYAGELWGRSWAFMDAKIEPSDLIDHLSYDYTGE